MRADDPGVTIEALPSFDTTRPVAPLRLDHDGAEACLALSVEHAQQRRQFNRAIGSFQAVKYLCADMPT